MDPKATLETVEQFLKESDKREAAALLLCEYFRWRLRKGFEPENGDERAFSLLTALGRGWDVMGQAADFERSRKERI